MKRLCILLTLCLAPAVPALAQPDQNLMDLNEGPWQLTADGGDACSITLGDRPAKNFARVVSNAADCRGLVPALKDATAWRIDEPGTLVFLSDSDRVLLSLPFDSRSGNFKNSSFTPALILEPQE